MKGNSSALSRLLSIATGNYFQELCESLPDFLCRFPLAICHPWGSGIDLVCKHWVPASPGFVSLSPINTGSARVLLGNTWSWFIWINASQWSREADFSPRGILMSGDIFWLSQLGWYWHLVGRARGAATHPIMHRMPPTTKDFLAPSINSTKIEKRSGWTCAP